MFGISFHDSLCSFPLRLLVNLMQCKMNVCMSDACQVDVGFPKVFLGFDQTSLTCEDIYWQPT